MLIIKYKATELQLTREEVSAGRGGEVIYTVCTNKTTRLTRDR